MKKLLAVSGTWCLFILVAAGEGGSWLYEFSGEKCPGGGAHMWPTEGRATPAWVGLNTNGTAYYRSNYTDAWWLIEQNTVVSNWQIHLDNSTIAIGCRFPDTCARHFVPYWTNMTVHLESDTPVHQVVEQKVVIGGGNTSMACFVYGSVGGSAPTLTLGAASYDGPLHPLTDGPPKPWINPPGPNPQNPIQGPFETEIDEEPHQDYHIYTSAEGLDSFQYATNMVTDEYGYAHQWVNAGPATNALYFKVVAMVTNSWP